MNVKFFQQDQPINSQIVKGSKDIFEFSKDWDDLFSRAVYAPPYLSRAWISTFIHEGRLHGTPLFILVWSGEKLVALLPLEVRRFLGIKIAEPISTGEPTYLGLLLDSDYPAAVKCTARILVQEKIAHCLCNSNLSSEDQATNELLDELVENSFLCLRVHRNPCYYIGLRGSYDEYLMQAKTAKRRKKLRYEEKRLFNSGNVVVRHYKGKEITPEVLGRVARIQEASWMKRRGAAVLGQPFYQKLLLKMAKANFGNVWLMTVDGEDASFVYTLVAHKKLYYYKTAFKLQFESSLSVGKVLTMQVIRNACDHDILSFDFGQGDGEYKRFWATDFHNVYRAAAGRGLGGRLTVLCFAFVWWLAKHQWLLAQYRRIKRKLLGGWALLSSICFASLVFGLEFGQR